MAHQQDIDMTNEIMNEFQQDIINSNEIILANTTLRNLFQLGCHSRSLTKTIANAVNINEVVNTIKSLAENEEISIKACGHLLLGLTRVYDKKIKLYYDDIMSIYKTKIKAEETNPMTKKKLRSKQSTTEQEDTEIDSSAAKANVLSLSPLNEGLFNMFNNSKDKFSSGLDTPSSQVLRAGIIDSEISQRLLESVNVGPKAPDTNEKRSFIEETKEPNNFFDFISDQSEAFNLKEFDLNLNISEQNTEDVVKRLSFSSELKSRLMSHFETPQLVTKPKKNIQKNPKLEYDEETNLEMDDTRNDDTRKEALLGEFKEKMRGEMTSFASIINESFLFPQGAKSLHEEANVLSHLSKMDIKEDFSMTMPIEEKISQLIDEMKEDNILPNIDEVNEDNYPQQEEEVNDQSAEKNKDYSKVLKVLNELMKKAKKSKKKVTFIQLKETMEKDSTGKVTVPNIFYNLLLLGQQGEIELQQGEIFNNDSIYF